MSDESWQVRGEVWRDDRVVLGGSDAGAHLDVMCHANYTTVVLGDLVRDPGPLHAWRTPSAASPTCPPVCSGSATAVAIASRARTPTWWCSTPTASGASRPRSATTCPAGRPRLYAEAVGIEQVVVGGRTIVEQGVLTGALPGTLLRSGVDTDTVTVPGNRSRSR